MPGALTLLALALLASAQTDKSRGHKLPRWASTQSDSVSADAQVLIKDVAENAEMLAQDFRDMNAEFDVILEIKDPTLLQEEMQKHQRMLTMMQQRMTAHEKICRDLHNMVKADSDSASEQKE